MASSLATSLRSFLLFSLLVFRRSCIIGAYLVRPPLTCLNSIHRHRHRLQRQTTIVDSSFADEISMLNLGARLFARSTSGSSRGAVVARTILSLAPNNSITMASRKRPLPALSPHDRCRAATTLKQTNNDNTDIMEQVDSVHRYRPLVVILAGPTAVGKSDVAAELCLPKNASDISQGHVQHFMNNHHNTEAKTTIASATRGHVVSADSVQAYRGVDIGANKPTREEMECTPHHLVNVVDPPTDPSKAASYNAADWMRDARFVIRELTSFDDGGEDDGEVDINDGGEEDRDGKNDLERKESIQKALEQSFAMSSSNELSTGAKPTILPVVVGGTMMYLQWLVHGRPDAIRPTNEAVDRAASRIEAFQKEAKSSIDVTSNNDRNEEDEKKGGPNAEVGPVDVAAWDAASSYVTSLGPVFAQRVDKLPGRDWYRLRRLLEVAYTIATKKKSANDDDSTNQSEEEILQSLTEKEVYTGVRSGSLPDLGYDVRCFFLCPDERMTHFHTVDQRCEQMLQRGLLRETATLYGSGGLPEESQVTRAIGYRQTLEYLQRKNAKRNDNAAFMAFVDTFATATRQYGKKQMQWFRRDGQFAFVPVQMTADKPTRVADAANIIADMCKLCPEDFDAELYPTANESDESGKLPLSAQTKLDNERQGKKMKVFLSKRSILIEGSDEFSTVLAEADECTKMVQSLGDEF